MGSSALSASPKVRLFRAFVVGAAAVAVAYLYPFVEKGGQGLNT